MDKKIKKELIEKLKTISEDNEFLLSIINYVRSSEDRKVVIDYIDKGDDVTYETIILLALTIYEEREKQVN